METTENKFDLVKTKEEEVQPYIDYCDLMFGEEAEENKRDWQIASAAFLAGQFYRRDLCKEQMNKLITGMANEILLDKKYTQEQYDKAIEDTWYAAREKFIIDRNPADKQYRFLSLQQYLSTIKNK